MQIGIADNVCPHDMQLTLISFGKIKENLYRREHLKYHISNKFIFLVVIFLATFITLCSDNF